MKKCNKSIKCKQHKNGICNKWSPLLLIIPLRLGLNEFNSDYKDVLKVSLSILLHFLVTFEQNSHVNKKIK